MHLNKMGMSIEPFTYGVEEVKAYDGHLDPNQAVACENVPVIGILEDNKALATEGEFLPEPVVEEPTEPTTNEEPTVEP